MNSTRTLLTLGAAALLPLALSADTITTTPVGYTTHTIVGNGISVFGPNLIEPSLFQGTGDISGTEITSTGADFSGFDFTVPHFVRILDGASAGWNATVTGTNGADTLVVELSAAQLASTPPADGFTFSLHENWTIAKIFGENNEVGINGGSTRGAADNVLIPSGGSFEVYYYKSSGFGGTGWRGGPSGSDPEDAVINFSEGVLVQRKVAGDVSFKLVGAVAEGPTEVYLVQGVNVISNLVPVASETIGNSGLYFGTDADGVGIVGGSTRGAADNVLVPASGSFDVYYYKSSGFGGTGWRGPNPDAELDPLPLDSGYLVQVKGTSPLTVKLTPSY
jgi:hypothetical protein